jgi:hypothetical protein
MEWNPPGDKSYDVLPPGVTPTTDASRKKVYHLKAGPNVVWFLSQVELEGRPPAKEDPYDEPREDDMLDTSSNASKNILDGDNDDDGAGDTNDHRRVTTL